MGTFPAATDYQRPLPAAQTSVATSTAAPAPQGSNVAAQAQYEAGAANIEFAKEVDKVGLQLDATAAQEGVNQLRRARSEFTYGEQDGFMRIQGGDVLKPDADGRGMLQRFPPKLQARADEIMGKLAPRARLMFNPKAEEEVTAYGNQVLSHQMQQTDAYQKATFKDTTAILFTEAARNSGDPKAVEGIVGKIEKATANFARSQGMPVEGAVAAARSNGWRTAIEDRIARNDGAGALSMFAMARDKLDAKDLIEVGRQVKTVEVGQVARSYVQDLNVDIAKRRDDVIKTMGGGDNVLGAAWAASFMHESEFRTSARNKGDGRDGSDSINLGQWNGPRAKALEKFAADNKLDMADPATAMAYAQAEVDGVIPYSVSGLTAGFKERLKAAPTAEAKAALLTAEYFRPKSQAEPAARGETAKKMLADYQKLNDPLAGAVNQAAPAAVPGQAAAEGPPGFLDTRKMNIDAERWKIEATKQNMTDWAANPTQLAANQHLIDVQFNQRKAAITLAKDQLNSAVQDWVAKPLPNGAAQTERPPPAIWNQLTFEQQRSIDSTLTHNAKGKDAVTNQAVWYEIQSGLSSADPKVREEWANKPLWPYKKDLSNNDFQELAKMQGVGRKGDPDKDLSHVRSINQLTDDALLTMGIDSTPKAGSGDATKAADFRRSIQEQVTAFEQTKGKKSTAEEQQKIIDMQVRKVAGTGGWFSRDKRQYEMKINDVPAPEKVKIEEALRRAGRAINDRAIIDLYSAKNAVKP